ncbi:MAG TPA: sigma-70 family RNA polymerase sigma factor [Candidatus Eisenbacteria bacterium]|jgi:RNA polymerase sigma-70 factor (ECF subfamily)
MRTDPGPHPLESTAVLLDRIRAGDAHARDRLLGRYLPVLNSWVHGRLPRGARGMADTADIVQVTLYRALNRLEEFENRHEGAFFAYLRQIVLNALREEIRRSVRRPSAPGNADEPLDQAASVVEQAIGREMLECYEQALLRLTDEQREAVVLRMECGLSYPEIAGAMGKPSANAARMLVVRALVPLAEAMREHAHPE